MIFVGSTSAPPTGHARRSSKPWRSWMMTNTATMCAPCAVPTPFFGWRLLNSDDFPKRGFCWAPSFVMILHYVVAKLFTSYDYFEQKEEDGFRMVPYTCFHFFVCLKFSFQRVLEIRRSSIIGSENLTQWLHHGFWGRDPNFPPSPTGADRRTTGTVWVTVLSRNCCWRRANWKGDAFI